MELKWVTRSKFLGLQGGICPRSNVGSGKNSKGIEICGGSTTVKIYPVWNRTGTLFTVPSVVMRSVKAFRSCRASFVGIKALFST